MNTLTLTVQIIGAKADLKFNFAEKIDIISSRDNFTDTATIMIPQKDKQWDELISINDVVTVKAGFLLYDETQIFNGYITSVEEADGTIILKCEDEAFQYKQVSLQDKQLKNQSLKSLIEFYYKGETNLLDVKIGTWRVGKNATFVDLLNELNQKFGFKCYWQTSQLTGLPVLYIGTAKDASKRIIFDYDLNIELGGDSIELKKDDSYSTVVHGVSPQRNGTNIEIYAYFKDPIIKDKIVITTAKPNGNINELKIPNLTKAELTELCKIRLKSSFVNAVGGSISGIQHLGYEHGDEAELKNFENVEKNGIYDIIAVTYAIDANGFTQVAEIGDKIVS